MENNIDLPSNQTIPDTTVAPWKEWQKIGFRFSFWVLGLTTFLNWVLIVFFSYVGITSGKFDPTSFFKFMVKPFYWLDSHLFRTGYDPKTHGSFPQDNHFGSVFYLTIILISVLLTIAWSFTDRKKTNYNKLLYWFNIYLRYILAITIIGYGIDKFIPVQMNWPDAATMLSPYGDQSKFAVLWNFMGMSPGYMILTGGCEIIAGLLLFNRRTLLFGYLFLLTILINVVALNWFYNVPVKMYSAQLMVYNLFLLLPYLNKLTQFFFFDKTTIVSLKQYRLTTKWKNRLLTSILVFIPLIVSVLTTYGTYKRYTKNIAANKSEKMYNVTAFIVKDTLPPLTSDTLRWKRLLMNNDRAIVVGMTDGLDWYQYDVDSIKNTFTFHDNPDKKTWKVFKYNYPAKDQLQLTGKWKGNDIKVLMKYSSVDSISLNKEKIKLVQD